MNSAKARVAVPGLLALIFLAFHLRFLPHSLEDLDSINFALGVRHYDVAEHQPHPPGYPIYILMAKGLRMLVGSELSALSVLSAIAGAVGIVAIGALVRRIGERDGETWPLAATLIAITTPLYWFTAARPLSDMTGLAAAVWVQAMTLAATTPRMLYVAAFCAALATGIRSQIAWLTVPLLMFRGLSLDEDRERLARGPEKAALRLVIVSTVFAAGVLVWFIPLVALTGGPARYFSALSFQGSADIGNIQMLWTRHGARDVADAMYYAFVAPWATGPLAATVLVFATIGLLALAMRSRRALVVLVAAFGPYFVFDLLFQETFTSRYALPLVIPIGYLAAAGARILPWRSGMVGVAAVAMYSAHVGGTSVAAFAQEKAPAFRLLDDMVGASRQTREPPVLAMDRKQSFDFRRPIKWQDGALPAFASVLPVPPQHEWLEAVKYWTGGGRAPVWFVVDPKRSMIDLVQHDEPGEYRWEIPYPVLVGGARPDEMDFYRVDHPAWFVGEGWALTPEAAGIAEADHRGPGISPIEAWISERVFGGAMMIGGRNLSSAPARVDVEIMNGALNSVFPSFTAQPGSFVKLLEIADIEPPRPPGSYVSLRLRTPPEARVAIEQFDAGRRHVLGFGNGWQEREFNPRTGRMWRWLSERGELLYLGEHAVLHLEGEAPRTYFSRDSRLLVRHGSTVLFDQRLGSDFSFNIDIPATDRTARIRTMPQEREPEVLTLETDQVFQPADRSRRSADHRHLGLRIFKCELRPAS